MVFEKLSCRHIEFSSRVLPIFPLKPPSPFQTLWVGGLRWRRLLYQEKVMIELAISVVHDIDILYSSLGAGSR